MSSRRRGPVSRLVTATGIIITLVAWAGTLFHDLKVMDVAVRQHDRFAAAQALMYVALTSVLVYGSLVYLFARWGYLTRIRRHRPASDAELAAFQLQSVPAVTILVPSYKEEPGV